MSDMFFVTPFMAFLSNTFTSDDSLISALRIDKWFEKNEAFVDIRLRPGTLLPLVGLSIYRAL